MESGDLSADGHQVILDRLFPHQALHVIGHLVLRSVQERWSQFMTMWGALQPFGIRRALCGVHGVARTIGCPLR
jgi:hypothetical protein